MLYDCLEMYANSKTPSSMPFVLSDGELICLRHLPDHIIPKENAANLSLGLSLKEIEKTAIHKALERMDEKNGNSPGVGHRQGNASPKNKAIRHPADGGLRARAKITSHFVRRCIPSGCVAKPRHMPDMPAFSRLAGRALNS